ncbi:MAG TPA: hypothetical protein VIP48_13625, partial [Streptosporangiaceae bacterium]
MPAHDVVQQLADPGRPPSMSMTASRRWPSAACWLNQLPTSSGPRQAMVAVIAWIVSCSRVKSRSNPIQPVMP